MAEQNVDIVVRARDITQAAFQQVETALGDLEGSAVASSKKMKMSFSEMADSVAIVAGAVTLVAGTVTALGARGADVLDIKESFDSLNDAIGNDSVSMLATLKTAFGGTVSDFNLMKMANQSLSAGLKLSKEDFKLLAEGARVLSDRTGIDASAAYEKLSKAMLTGKTSSIAMLTGIIDNEKALNSYAAAIGKDVKELSAQQQKEALAIEIKEQLRLKVKETGVIVNDFADKVKANTVHVSNMVDSLGTWIAQKPAIAGFTSIMTGVGGAVSTVALSVGPLTKMMGAIGLTGSFATFTGYLSKTVLPLLTGALPLALKGLSMLFTMPAGLVVAGVVAALAVWKNWDTIGPIVKNVYTAVKTWLVDKFMDVVNGIKAKVDMVIGFFRNMYDKIVGHSYVPDLIKDIAKSFGELPGVMVEPAEDAVAQVTKGFGGLHGKMKGLFSVPDLIKDIAKSFGELPGVMVEPAEDAVAQVTKGFGGLLGKMKGLFSDLPKTIIGAFQGGGDVGKSISGSIFGKLFAADGGVVKKLTEGLSKKLGKELGEGIGSMIPGLGTLIGGFAGQLIGPLIGKVAGFFSSMFGGVSKAEKEGRAVADAFRKQLEASLSTTQKLEAGNDKWKMSVIAIRDAYIANGKTEAEAMAIADRLWKAEKQGAGAVEAVMKEINSVIDTQKKKTLDLTTASDKFKTGFVGLLTDIVSTGALASNEMVKVIQTIGQTGQMSAEVSKFITANLTSAVGGIGDFVKNAAITSQNAAMAMTGALAASFNELLAKGMSTGDALKLLTPVITDLEANLKKAGFNGGTALAGIKQMAAIVAGEVSGPAITAVNGLGQTLIGLHNVGLMDKAMFQALSGQITDTFANNIAKGNDANAAMKTIQPTLQTLWEMHNNLGYPIDEATAAMLNQAQAAGIVGAAHVSAQDKIYNAMAEVAGLLKNFLEHMGASAAKASELAGEVGGVKDQANQIPTNPFDAWDSGSPLSDLQTLVHETEKIPTNPFDNWDPPEWEWEQPPGPEGYATGGYDDFGAGRTVRVHGKEAIIPTDRPSAVGSQMARDVAAQLGSNAGTTVEVRMGNVERMIERLVTTVQTMPAILTSAQRDAMLMAGRR